MEKGTQGFSMSLTEQLLKAVMQYVAEKGEFPPQLSVSVQLPSSVILLNPQSKVRKITWAVNIPPFKEATIQEARLLAAAERPPQTWQQYTFPVLAENIFFVPIGDEVIDAPPANLLIPTEKEGTSNVETGSQNNVDKSILFRDPH